MYSSIMTFRNRSGHKDRNEETPEEVNRRFEQLAAATPELGGFGPRDWTPVEDTEGFVAPNPPLPTLRTRTKVGWLLLAAAIIGFVVLGITQPIYSAAAATLCLIALAVGLGLLLPLRRH
ncbi:Uncharacterised protein [Mobiluncus holmesii]|nr:Uncharacterised protein [Mobiluncus holmesii]